MPCFFCISSISFICSVTKNSNTSLLAITSKNGFFVILGSSNCSFILSNISTDITDGALTRPMPLQQGQGTANISAMLLLILCREISTRPN